jgi:pentatricopeptide repeat protein
VSALVKKAEADDAEAVLVRMIEDHVTPSVITFNMVSAGAGAVGLLYVVPESLCVHH